MYNLCNRCVEAYWGYDSHIYTERQTHFPYKLHEENKGIKSKLQDSAVVVVVAQDY